MPDKSVTDPMRKIKGLPKKPQTKTSNPITSPVAPGSRMSKRQSKQNALREIMENDAEDIINIMTVAIKTGLLGDEKISNSMRLDLVKNFLPYVLPQLKSVEYVEVKATDIQPLIINMSGGSANISIDSPGKSGDVPKEDLKVVNPVSPESTSHDTS